MIVIYPKGTFTGEKKQRKTELCNKTKSFGWVELS